MHVMEIVKDWKSPKRLGHEAGLADEIVFHTWADTTSACGRFLPFRTGYFGYIE
jgi:hypothetical protein